MYKGLLNERIVSGCFAILVAVASFLPVTAPFAYADFDCLSLTANATNEQRAYCQNQINDLEAQLKVLNSQLAAQKNQSGTLAGDIKVLTTKINAKKTEIQSKILKISSLNVSIKEKQKAISTLDQKIQREKDSLAQLLRKTNEMDSVTLTSFMLADTSLSSFYSDVSRFDSLKQQVRASIDTINTIKGVTVQKKAELEKEQDTTIDEKSNLELVKKTIEQDQATQKTLLSISKNKEAAYAKVIADQQAKVAQIKSKLFQLAGGSSAIRFDQALVYAQKAQEATGIDPAFLLAELTQESNLGSNVGKCYLTDPNTGAGVSTTGKKFTNVMKATRDVKPFLEITQSLGLDPYKTVVSCPIADVAGYGGAMGPAQFIASTWKIFAARVAADLGKSVANPWVAEDAFMAASLYLTDLGGAGSSAAAQLRASCRYYGSGGSTCSYGRSVQTLKIKIQSDIDYLNQYGVSRR